MANKIILSVQKREIFGAKVKKLRSNGLIPANIYGTKIKSQSIQVVENDFKKTYKEAGETTLVYLNIADEKEKPTLIVGVQLEPVNQKILHVDFRQVDLTQKITAQVDLVLIGKSPAEQSGLVIVTLRNSVEVKALPTDLPEKIEVNIQNLVKTGDTITVADLKIDNSKVEILLEKDETVIQVEEKQKEVVEEVPVVEVVEGEETKEGVTEGKVEDKKDEKVKEKVKEDKKD